MKITKEVRNIILTVIVSTILSIALFVLPIDYKQLGNWGYLGLFIGVFWGSATIILPTPAFAFTIIAGKFLNPYLVGIVSGAAATLGELVGYYVGHETSQLLKTKPSYKLVEKFVRKFGFFFLLFFAMIPNPLFDLAGIAAGTMNMPVWQYVVAVFIGKSIRFILLALGGNALS